MKPLSFENEARNRVNIIRHTSVSDQVIGTITLHDVYLETTRLSRDEFSQIGQHIKIMESGITQQDIHETMPPDRPLS